MCGFSSSFNIGWPLEDPSMSHIDDLQQQNWSASDHDLFMDLNYKQVLKASDHVDDSSVNIDATTAKKINHNASERDRRKKLNSLYTALRSLLPATDQTKKLSIPATVSRVLKYIPELQKQVERLVERKEEILSSISKQGDHFANNNYLAGNNRENKRGPIRLQPQFSSVSTSQIDDKEVIVQICAPKFKRNSLSEVLLNLEKDEQLQILNASSLVSTGNRVFYTLHLQVKEATRVECELLNEKVLFLCERKDQLFA